MGWRNKMGSAVAFEHSGTLAQKPQKPQKEREGETFVPFVPSVPRSEKLKSDDSGGFPSFPVLIIIDSTILGAGIHVALQSDQATVDGVQYTNDELVDLLSRELKAEEIRAIHEVKRTFDGEVIPSDQAAESNKG